MRENVWKIVLFESDIPDVEHHDVVTKKHLLKQNYKENALRRNSFGNG